MSTEGQRVDDSPSTSGGSSDGDQREGVQQEQEREQVQPKKKEGKISSKTAAKLSTSAKRIQKELAEITLDPPPNCRGFTSCLNGLTLLCSHFTPGECLPHKSTDNFFWPGQASESVLQPTSVNQKHVVEDGDIKAQSPVGVR
ncbi:Ubiquitin-conjugating enzyme E2 E2 [Chelonia mydas]|uniref:Ubiquitin-conjugating enzyme E2 E2 n=1 Tax=Chelonia mydas TaxID=8469 RepID=M7BVT2_CHEMY|nr:Ubiquitin-conjugating enzyme E2 E2 [Chelonia mydas]